MSNDSILILLLGNVLHFFLLYLQQAATCLSELNQSPPASILEAMQPFLNAIVQPVLLKHQDKDVKLLVATCICEITRITAPEAPYSDDVLKVHFLHQGQLVNGIDLFISKTPVNFSLIPVLLVWAGYFSVDCGNL